MTARPVQSLRVRLVLGLSLTLCVLWGSVAAWMFPTMQRELRTMLDDRLVASARMVVGILHQFQATQAGAMSPANNALLLSTLASSCQSKATPVPPLCVPWRVSSTILSTSGPSSAICCSGRVSATAMAFQIWQLAGNSCLSVWI